MPNLFPTLVGKNLNKQKITIPEDFSNKDIIIIIAFQRWHQPLVDTIITNLEQINIEDRYHLIEVPVVSHLSIF